MGSSSFRVHLSRGLDVDLFLGDGALCGSVCSALAPLLRVRVFDKLVAELVQ